MNQSFDIAIVGAGFVGIAHAWAAAKAGKRVVVFDRDLQATGASTRGLGLVSVSGQRGVQLQRARRSREVWLELAEQAGLTIDQRGLLIAARRPEARRVLEAFVASPAGEGTELVNAERAVARVRNLRLDGLAAAVWSPFELRIDGRLALPRLARWLSEHYGVEVRRGVLVRDVAPPRLETTSGVVRAEAVIVCPGDEFQALFAERIAHYKLTRCKTQMLRVRAARRIGLGAVVMSDLALLRAPAFAEMPDAGRLRARLDSEQRDAMEAGVQLIAAQAADGSLVVGGSHAYSPTSDGISSDRIDRLILQELDTNLDLGGASVMERWTTSTTHAADRPMFVDRPCDAVRVVMISGGNGISTAFAVAEEVVGTLLGAGASGGRRHLAA